MAKYKQYNLLLDEKDEEELELVKFLESLKGNKMKNSYSAILKKALKVYMKIKNEKNGDTTK